MKNRLRWSLLALAVLAGVAALLTLVIVRAGEVAVLATFGRPVRVLEEPGLYSRWPWPVQEIHRFDARLQVLEGVFEETYTLDHRNVVVTAYVCWRIREPRLFLERVGSVRQAERNLEGLVRHYKNGVFGRHPFADFVNTNPAALKFAEVEDEILQPVRAEALDRYGLEVAALGIRRLSLPESITAAVFQRMISERQALAEAYRAQGDAEAMRLRAEADRRRDQLLADADAQATRLRAEAEEAAARSYLVFAQNPSLAIFLRKLDALESTLRDKAVVVLGTDTPPYDLLRGDGSSFSNTPARSPATP
jgi:membrane protease subunit HflC